MRRGPLTGRLLSRRWRVGELLGHGGMSAVYEATHRNGKRVALKVLRFELLGNDRSRRRFMREGYIANRVGHPGVVAVLDDAVSEDGAAFLVMELLEGMNVEQYCTSCGGELPVDEVLAIVDAVLDILAAAHAKRVVHRDIKPSNLFLTTTGNLKLLDFGIASFREVSGTLNTTGEGVVLGTPGFMAPEQARGRWKDVDARTDLWAVGALMFRLLTGRLVYETENSNEYVIAAATESVPSLATIAPAIPLAVAELVDRALLRDPEARFQSASEMRAAVRAELPRFAHCAVPRAPRNVSSDTTLDDALSTAGIANELPPVDRLETLPAPAAGSTRRFLPWFAYGVLGALGLLIAIHRDSNSLTNIGTTRSAPKAARESRDGPSRAPQVAFLSEGPLSSLSVETSALSLPDGGPRGMTSASAANTRSVPLPMSAGSRGGTSHALSAPSHAPAHPAPSPSASSPSAMAAKQAPTRLEDMLDERR